ncbi:hypothetical protein [Flavobacterium johnsoniae]|uniref:Uncharacterized protein n=1 Tax=Flavobacterium johnsoniae (strain ATCC 17061 / DSM 2064 / JCM 8514 / BCRC 14874 / CCUG 350202 / NBRC 14942 / NCIMB 11054 / UW101) TaxID=376686 RepID=A5FBX6_FLAJ1|nr:hypothetical protein [Flavobacterium johnsoniae]ABQ07285.1 hypothetical protein Fjoh_4277 [Flavobacterium johnsoniae UW101]OXE95647.1 hypothetical protein B0A63_23790 [Flavobacterium johnsoniae UW101]WQG80880.1 hypothetical protein SR927_23055 [Flavobacterium johnsoniae UW101]SHL17624.1 hypothetical protein SAMN05444146_3234 [Flavobacterium johnsoniae]
MENLIIPLLGKSLKSKEILSFIRQYNLPANPKIELDYLGDIFESKSANEKSGIYMTFEGYKRFKYGYGEPAEIIKNPDKSLFLTEISLENDYTNNKIPSIIKFPFGLIQGDDYKTVVNKIGKKPNKKGVSSYGKYYWTEFDDYRILTAFDKDLEILIWIRIKKLTLQEKEKIRLKKFLNQQSKNINPDNADLILSFLYKLPTIEWEKRRKNGDKEFTKEKIGLIETLLKDYINTLIKLTKEKKASSIFNSIKKLVLAINKINPKYDYFIETMEREELCQFINDIIRNTGLEFEANFDLTEEWREW